MSFDLVTTPIMVDIINNVTANKITEVLKSGKFAYEQSNLFENRIMYEVLKPKNYNSKFLQNILKDDFVEFDKLGNDEKFDIVTLLFFCYNQVCFMLGLEYNFDAVDDMPKEAITKFDISELKKNNVLFSLVMSKLNTH